MSTNITNCGCRGVEEHSYFKLLAETRISQPATHLLACSFLRFCCYKLMFKRCYSIRNKKLTFVALLSRLPLVDRFDLVVKDN